MTSREVELRPSPARRVAAAAMLGTLAALLLGLAIGAEAMALPRRGLMAMGGIGAALLTRALWRVGGRAVRLTGAGLVESATGRAIAPMARIVRVERGAFAFKPSGGFLVTLDSRLPAAWAPGLWWRLGRRVGIGGIAQPGSARAMADTLAAELARRGG